MDSVSNRLKNLREGQNLKQKEVAEYLGLSQQSYSRYENDGMNELPLRYLEPLAMLYRVSSDYILGISISEQDLASISQNVYNDISLENIWNHITLLDKKQILKLSDYLKYLIYEMNEEQK